MKKGYTLGLLLAFGTALYGLWLNNLMNTWHPEYLNVARAAFILTLAGQFGWLFMSVHLGKKDE